MAQDFTKRFAIAVNKELPMWQILNTVAQIGQYLGNKLDAPFDTEGVFRSREGAEYPRNSQYPTIVFGATGAELKKFMPIVRESGLLYLAYLPEMVETTDDEEIEKLLGGKTDAEIEYYGIGVFGPDKTVKPLFKKFSLWK
jgi:hypothetical protein